MLSDVSKVALLKHQEGIESQIKQLNREKVSCEAELQRINNTLNELTGNKTIIESDLTESNKEVIEQ